MKPDSYIIVLGATNDHEGNLSPMAISRLEKVLEIYKDEKIICTGGFGSFNQSSTPHAEIMKDYLLKKGLSGDHIHTITKSTNTVEDIVHMEKFLKNTKADSITIATSDYHMERVKFICKKILDGYSLNFAEAKTPKSNPELLKKLLKHEKEALVILKNRGLILPEV